MLAQWYLSWVLWSFLIGSLHDLHRKYCLMIQLSFLIKPRKWEKYSSYCKQLPTIQLVSKNSLKAWSALRNIVIDYGKRFFIRVEKNIGFALVFSLVPIGFSIYDMFTKKEQHSIILYISILFNPTIIWILSSFSLYYGAYINQFFIEHRTILEEDR